MRPKLPKIDPLVQKTDSLKNDSISSKIKAGGFPVAKSAAEQLVYAENEVFKVAFTTHGGQPKWVELKRYKNQDSGLVKLAGTDFDKISYTVNTGDKTTDETTDETNLLFSKIDSVKNADGSTTYSLSTQSNDSASAASITHQFTVKKNDYHDRFFGEDERC